MSSFFRFLKRKIKRPFRHCVAGSPSSPFAKYESPKDATKLEETNELENVRSTTIQSAKAKLVPKRENSRPKLRRTPQKNDTNCQRLTLGSTSDSATQSTDLGFGSSSISKSMTISYKSCDLENAFIQNIANTPIYSLSSSQSNTDSTNIASDSIGCSSKCDAIHSVDDKGNIFTFQPNLNTSESSMITYKTKYANSELADDDGLISASSVSLNRNPQQSTPFNEVSPKMRIIKSDLSSNNLTYQRRITKFEARIQSLKIESLSLSPNLVRHYGDILETKSERRKCRRSNTTYTISKRNKIIDYFNKLEMTKQLKKHKEKVREVNRVSNIVDLPDFKSNRTNKSDANMSDNNIDEMERMQDVFFQDDESYSNQSASTTNENLLTSFLDSMDTSIGSKESCHEALHDHMGQTKFDSNSSGRSLNMSLFFVLS